MPALLRPLTLAVLLAMLGIVAAASPLTMRVPDGSSPSLGDTSTGDISLRYVALGDSYTAAPLVPPMSMAGGCLRSERNYPSLVAAALPGVRLADRSCSQADSSHLSSPQDTGRAVVPPQLDAVGPDTDLVTLAMGGNDFDLFGNLMGHCTALRDRDPAGRPCRDAAQQPGGGDVYLEVLPRIRTHLVSAVREIRRRAPDAEVIVVGYPQIVPAHSRCAALPFAAGDVAYARMVNRRLVTTVEEAARRAHATYVDVWKATAGHDICADDPWINGARTVFEKALAYHPFAAEQEAVAELVLAEL
ncbi:SGNH/GDSL hydrolase family protein [Nocardioides sp. LHG3406-4]|uniref:SGNH/GDSL hydrolase family protein n=1 Tax=Nocardioides sp. LHG3406-4 TaxID=2804575 RepID=UPI003CFB472D